MHVCIYFLSMYIAIYHLYIYIYFLSSIIYHLHICFSVCLPVFSVLDARHLGPANRPWREWPASGSSCAHSLTLHTTLRLFAHSVGDNLNRTVLIFTFYLLVKTSLHTFAAICSPPVSCGSVSLASTYS